MTSLRTFRDVLTDLERTESAAVAAYRSLYQLRAEGLATTADYQQYEALRTTLLTAQRAAVSAARALIARAAPEYVARVPTPIPLPRISMDRVEPMPGLGNPALLIAAALIALFEIAALVWLLSEVVNMGLATYEAMARVRARAEQYQRLLQARQVAYQMCVQSGGAAAACAEHAIAVAPSPADSDLQIDVTPAGAARSSKFWWGVAAVTGAVGLGYWLWARYAPAGSAGVRGLGAPHRVSDLDGSKSRYNLEVR